MLGLLLTVAVLGKYSLPLGVCYLLLGEKVFDSQSVPVCVPVLVCFVIKTCETCTLACWFNKEKKIQNMFLATYT